MTDRAQTFTIEAVVAAVLLLGTVVFVTQAGGVSPLTASTASQQVSEQRQGDAVGVLDAAAANGNVRSTLLYWNEEADSFYRTGDELAFVSAGPPTAFGQLLNETFGDRAVTFNVNAVYVDESGQPTTLAVVRQGTPSDEAVVGSRTVTLFDDDVLRDANESRTSRTLENASFYAPDVSNGPVYNVVRVEVVVWSV